MYFELQLSADVFARIVRNRLKAIPLCVDRELTDADGNLLVADQVVIGESTWIQREQTIELVNGLPQPKNIATQLVWIFSPLNYTSFTVPFLQVKQEVKIHLVKSADLDANGTNPTAPFKTLTIYPVFNVSLKTTNQTQGGGPITLSYSLAHVDFGLLILAMPEAQRAQINQFIAGVQLPPTTMDLGPLTSLMQRPVSAVNAGIACDPSGSFLSLRVDFDVYETPDNVLNRSFFEAGPVNLLAGKQWAMLIDVHVITKDAGEKAKAALQGAPKVKLDSGPHVSWDPGGPAIDITAAVELVDACPFFIDDIDMDADVTIRAGFSVPVPNTLRRSFYINGEPSDMGEEIACALTGALLWPFVGPLFLKNEDIGAGIGAYIGGLAVGPVFTFIGIIVAIETKGLSKDISKEMGSTCKKLDDEHYECDNVLNLTMAFHPTFNSRLDLEVVSGVPQGLVFSGNISNLRDYFMGHLEMVHAKPFAWQIIGRCRGNGKNNFSVGNQAVITVHATPPAGMCKAYILSDPEKEFVLTVDGSTVTIVPRFRLSYTANPYPCRVRIITNRGVRTVTLAPPAFITDAESEELETARLRAVASCYFWEKIFTPVEKVKWLPDPPFVDQRYIQFWQVAVRGLQPQDVIRVEGLENAPVMAARPSRAGVAHMAMVFPGERALRELTMELRSERQEEGGEERELSVQQVLYEHRATLPISGAIRAMRFEGTGRGRQLAITDAEQDMVWNVSVPEVPVLLQAVASKENANDRRVMHNGKRIGDEPGPGFLRSLERLEERFGRAEVIGSPRVGGIGETLYMRTVDGAMLFDISNTEEEPVEMHSFGREAAAWFEGVAMGGRLLARYDPSLNVVEIYAATVTKMI